MSELIRALAAFAEAPGPEHARLADALGLDRPPTRAEHTDLFLFQLHPYASVYVGAEGMLGGEGRDRVAGFWRALELVPPPEPDHLGSLLGLYAGLRAAEGDSPGGGGGRAGQAGAGAGAEEPEAAPIGLRRARAALLREHVASWIFPWLERAVELGAGPYRRWAEILREALLAELREIEAAEGGGGDAPVAPGGPPSAPPVLPLHLREAPPLSDPRHEEGDFLAEILAPVRSGMILARADLVRAGRALGLGVRVGERRYTLEGLFGQDPEAVLRWLAAEAAGWARRHGRLEGELGPTGAFWRERAERTTRLLEELAETAAEAVPGAAKAAPAASEAAPATAAAPPPAVVAATAPAPPSATPESGKRPTTLEETHARDRSA